MAKREKKKAKEKKQKTPRKKGAKKGAAIILVVALVISVATVVLSKIVLWPKFQEFQAKKKTEKVEQLKAKKQEMGELYEMKSFTVNTFQSGGRRFAKVKLSLETHDEEVIPELEKRNVQVRSLMIKYFRSKTVADLTHPDFPDSSAADLIEQVNKLLTSGSVDNLYYQDLIVQ